MIYLYIILGIFTYLIIGRVIANYMIENISCVNFDYEDYDMNVFLITIFFPIAIIWISAICIGNKISDLLF